MLTLNTFPTGIYMFKVNNKDTRVTLLTSHYSASIFDLRKKKKVNTDQLLPKLY